ncbi:LLM class flavin-dependent oxidoreductase [Nakamurella lactea]|uniref:LLM class flavin-dependent oxidoreductase n=1 Tax=Nakamurella lactea TaxID=459515 RepID=UPI000688DD10|nr:LLM class flavin-dependent oxidoreductase [Nakamurella lactea]
MLLNRGPVLGVGTVGDLVDTGVAAEEAGWDSVWVGDSFLAKPRVESIVLLAAIAARTKRVRLGPACMASTPLREPLLLAHQWANLDLLSQGRTIFVACQGGGPGSGEFAQELVNLGLQRSSRMRRMEEAIEIMRLAWGGDGVDFDGTYTQFSDVTLLPKPAQRVPIWIAANPDLKKPNNVETAYRRVARYADGWQTTHTTVDDIARSWEIIQQYFDEAERPLPHDFQVSVCSNICLAESKEAAFDESKRFLDAHSMTDYSSEFLQRWVAMGTPDDCVQYLRRFVAAGATSILLRISSFDQAGQFERITREVLPALRD